MLQAEFCVACPLDLMVVWRYSPGREGDLQGDDVLGKARELDLQCQAFLAKMATQKMNRLSQHVMVFSVLLGDGAFESRDLSCSHTTISRDVKKNQKNKGFIEDFGEGLKYKIKM